LLNIYRRLIAVQIRSQMQYPISFILDAFATGMATFISFITVALVLQRFDHIAGWKLGEVAFLFGSVETAFSGFDPDHFAFHIRLGRLDQLLLRPVNVTVQVLGSQFAMRRLGRVAQGVLVLVISFQLVDIQWTPAKIAFLPVVIFSMICFFGGLFITGSTITFWTIQRIEAVNIFTYGGTEMMSYPMSIYNDWMRRFFTYILPAIFLNYYPALYILDKPDPFGMPAFAPFLAPAAGLGLLLAALAFWNYGLAHYQSTGT